MKLTSANIDLPKDRDDIVIFDSELRGFGLRIRRGSDRILKSWLIQKRMKGRMRRMLVGNADVLTAAQARAKARKLLAEIELGHDPAQAKIDARHRDAATLKHMIDQFLESKTGVKPGTLVSLKRYLAGPLYLGALRSLPVETITRKDIAARVLAVSKANGARTSIIFRSALSSMFTWALTMGLVETNPLIGAYKPPKPPSRDRVLSDAEIATIWRNLRDDYGRCVRLIILTGARRQEVGGMSWDEIDLDKGTWTLPASRAKNGKALVLPVTPLMMSIIEAVPQQQGDFLFGRKRGFAGWSDCKRALDNRIDLKPWTHHDLRRSVSTGMGDLGVQPHVIEEILNHKSGSKAGVAGVYNKSPYANEVRAAMALWSDHIRSIVEGGERKVLAFQRAAEAAL